MGKYVGCRKHKPRQHRDGRPPWRGECGKTADGLLPRGVFDDPKDDWMLSALRSDNLPLATGWR